MIELDLSRPWDADDPLGSASSGRSHGWRNPPPWLVPTMLAVLIVVGLGRGGGAAARPGVRETNPQAGLAFAATTRCSCTSSGPAAAACRRTGRTDRVHCGPSTTPTPTRCRR